jgi:hypothetical protein
MRAGCDADRLVRRIRKISARQCVAADAAFA